MQLLHYMFYMVVKYIFLSKKFKLHTFFNENVQILINFEIKFCILQV